MTADMVKQQMADGIKSHCAEFLAKFSATQESMFAPYAKAIRDGHLIAYDLPRKPEATRPLTPEELKLESAAAELIAYYDRPNGYSGD